jgi:hypothetical protein
MPAATPRTRRAAVVGASFFVGGLNSWEAKRDKHGWLFDQRSDQRPKAKGLKPIIFQKLRSGMRSVPLAHALVARAIAS